MSNTDNINAMRQLPEKKCQVLFHIIFKINLLPCILQSADLPGNRRPVLRLAEDAEEIETKGIVRLTAASEQIGR